MRQFLAADPQRLDPSAASVDRARVQVLDVIRAVQEIDTSRLAAPFVAADPPRVEGFRRLLQLRESDPAAMERLVEILTVFEP